MYGYVTTFWLKNMDKFGTQEALARSVIDECLEDSKRGYQDPTPWLALCDLIEDCGQRTGIRYVVKRCFNLPSPSSSSSS